MLDLRIFSEAFLTFSFTSYIFYHYVLNFSCVVNGFKPCETAYSHIFLLDIFLDIFPDDSLSFSSPMYTHDAQIFVGLRGLSVACIRWRAEPIRYP